jgi:amidohydrolase
MDLFERARRRIEADADALVALSHELHAHPELAYQEVNSCALVAGALAAGGLAVERGAYGLPTALRATAGDSGPHLVLCAEYDALPGIGHACGHNIIAASAVGAGLALAEQAGELGIRVTVLGTPAEERGGGKVDLIRAGAFEAVDLAMMVHPGPIEVIELPTLAWATLEVTYHGKASHASMAPELGVNALDALTISYAAIAALRQHIGRSERLHGIITHGGDAPNVVPAAAAASYYIRAADAGALQVLKGRALRCFEAGALATGCELEARWAANDYEEVRTNPTMAAAYAASLERLGRRPRPRAEVEGQAASTDMGNVSHRVPSIHPMMSIDSLPAVNHQAGFAAAAAAPAGDRAVVDAAEALAWTAIELATTPGAIAAAREDFAGQAAAAGVGGGPGRPGGAVP